MNLIDTLPEPQSYGWGIDWLTLTWPPESPMYALIKHGYDRLLRDLTGGVTGEGRIVECKQLGYGGWRLGKWRVGWRKDSAILIVTSAEAGNYGRIPHLDESRCTRIDIKCDLHYAWPRPYILEIVDDMCRRSMVGRIGRRPNFELHQPEAKPHWWEYGARGGALYLRIYDKWEEQHRDPAYDGVWRIEAELQEAYANEVFHAHVLRRGGMQPIIDCGLAAFAKAGIRLAGIRPGQWIDLVRDPRATDDVSKTMGWYRRVVASSVGKLKGQVDRDAILEALGLAEWQWQSDGGI